MDEDGYHYEAVENILPEGMKEPALKILKECPPKASMFVWLIVSHY